MKYIYFEIYAVDDAMFQSVIVPTMQNENILLIKPHTNSNGNWGYTNVTRSGEDRFTTVEQNWIDLTINYRLDKLITECTDKLNKKLREIKLERILN